MTPSEISELERLYAAADGGQWFCSQAGRAEWLVKNGDKNAFPTWIAALSVRGSGGKLNAEAIVAFRNALPALLAESKRTASLEADCQRLRKVTMAAWAYTSFKPTKGGAQRHLAYKKLIDALESTTETEALNPKDAA